MTVHTLPSASARPAGRRVASLVVLGDSTAVGLGDPLPAGGWRGFGPLLAGALGTAGRIRYANLAFTGARMGCMRHRQLARAVQEQPEVAVILTGMNDTLRSDFDPVAVHDDLDATVVALQAGGTVVVTTRFHALCLDLHLLPGVYHRSAWSVDRLHPSERGHRMLAAGFSQLLAGAGIAVPHPVDLDCSGGREVTAAHRLGWLVTEGVPWLGRRGRDFVPHAVSLMLRDLLGRSAR